MKPSTSAPILAVCLALVSCSAGAAESNGSKLATFVRAGSPIATGPMAGEPAVGDCNNDGFLDIVIPCGTCCGSPPSELSGHVQVLLGNGRGEFRKAPGSPIKLGSSARKVALGDVNLDQKLDIMVAQHDSYEVVVLMGDGLGGFKPASSSPLIAATGPRAHTHDIAVADLNDDRKLDILTTNSNDNTVSVLMGDGRGSFAPAAGSPFKAGRHPYDVVATADVNGDGKLDLVTPNLRGNAVMVMLGDGKGGFSENPAAPFPVQTRPGYVAVGDLNGDRKPDIAVTHDDYPIVAVLLGDGRGGFTPTPESPVRPAVAVWGVAIGDVNGDGMNDLVCGSQQDDRVTVLLGDGKGRFTESTAPAPRAGQLSNYVALADFNKDSRLDIVATSYGSGEVTVFLNTTK
jgi:hypothetical protein